MLLLPGIGVRAASYYVDSEHGGDANPGTSAELPWRTLARIRMQPLRPGDEVLLARGGVWDETLTLSSEGSGEQPILFRAYGEGSLPEVFALIVTGDHNICEDLVVDHRKAKGDAVRVRSARNCVLRGLTVRHGINDGVDIADGDGLRIESCHIHHFLAGSFDSQLDAHGIVATDTQGLTVQDTEIHHVSGDCFQADPDRDADVTNDILIQDCHFWTGPLESMFNAGWQAGQVPGENAVDTKVAKQGWRKLPRLRISIQNVRAHGWIRSDFIANRAAFNIKEKVEAILNGITVHDCEIAFRLRGASGNANVMLMNSVIYDCDMAIRAEDKLAGLRVYHTTFGYGMRKSVKFAGGKAVEDWDFRNNAFAERMPNIDEPPSNLLAFARDFADSQSHDYHLVRRSRLVNAGEMITWIETDRDGTPRSAPHDVGAYEYIEP